MTGAIDALLADDVEAVRRRAATNPTIAANRLIELLGIADPAGAAAN